MKKILFTSVAGFALLGATPIVSIPASQSISAADRAEGAKSHPELLAEYGGIYTGAQADYVTRVGRKVAAQSGISNVEKDFTITLLNSPVENAFAIPGGYVYTTRQLMALMNDEAELAYVLGHESGHIAAHHSEQRAKITQRDSILGALGQIFAAKVLGNGALGQMANAGVQRLAVGNIMSHSRAEEFEADDLGIKFMNQAGYDPRAASEMLASLGAQVELGKRIAGDARSAPKWAQTHPDPASRVSRAQGRAQELASRNSYRNNDTFLNSLKGMLYGDDPKQGVIEGQDFKYPTGRFQFTAPVGFTMSNSARAVTISGSGAEGQFGSGGKFNGDLNAYVESIFTALGEGKGQVTHTAIQNATNNGMKAATARATAQDSSGKLIDVSVVAYQFSPTQAYYFLIKAPQGQGLGALQPLVLSFRAMTSAEVAAVRPRKIDVVKVQRGDTVQSMAARMAYKDNQIERFTVLNALNANTPLVPGRRVKLVAWG